MMVCGYWITQLSDCLVVESLINGTTPHPQRLTSTNENILKQNTVVRFGGDHLLSDSNLFIDKAAGLLVNRLEFFFGDDRPVEQFLLETGNGVVGAAHTLDFFTATVGGSMVAVADKGIMDV